MHLVTPATVMVAHENAVVEAGLRHILAAWPEFEIQPQAGSSHLAPADPDVLLVDQDNGLQWAMNHRLGPASRTKVLIVAMIGQEADVRIAFEAGVRGYVFMGCLADEIVNATRAVAAGRRYLCSAATLRMADSFAQPTLTLRESQVLALVFRGLNNKEVARSLGICVGTVKSHMRGLLDKLGARCRTEALWIASQRGLIARRDEVASERASSSTHSLPSEDRATSRAPGDPSKALPISSFLQTAAA